MSKKKPKRKVTPRKSILLAEFIVQVFNDRIDWDGADRIILKLLNEKLSEGLLNTLNGPVSLRYIDSTTGKLTKKGGLNSSCCS